MIYIIMQIWCLVTDNVLLNGEKCPSETCQEVKVACPDSISADSNTIDDDPEERDLSVENAARFPVRDGLFICDIPKTDKC